MVQPRPRVDLFILDVLLSQQTDPGMIADRFGFKISSITRALNRMRSNGDEDAAALLIRWRRAVDDAAYVKNMSRSRKRQSDGNTQTQDRELSADR